MNGQGWPRGVQAGPWHGALWGSSFEFLTIYSLAGESVRG